MKAAAYGFGSDATRTASDWWWLRSPAISANKESMVLCDGSINDISKLTKLIYYWTDC